MNDPQQFVFIIGCPRSGTTWLQALLGEHPSVCTTEELKLFDFFTGPWAESWQKLVRLSEERGGPALGLTGAWSKEEFNSFLREFVDRVYARVSQKKPAATVFLDKTPRYAHYVEHINDLIPNARFIHMIRDGRDVTSSLRSASRSWAKSWAPSDPEYAAEMWLNAITESRQAMKFGERYLEVRYENLMADGARVLASLFGFLKLEADEKLIRAILEQNQFQKMKDREQSNKEFFRKGQMGDWQESMTPRERYLFHMVAGELLCELGYAEPWWWIEHAYQRVTLPLLSVFPKTGFRRRIKAVHAVKSILGPAWMNRLGSIGRFLRGRSTAIQCGCLNLYLVHHHLIHHMLRRGPQHG